MVMSAPNQPSGPAPALKRGAMSFANRLMSWLGGLLFLLTIGGQISTTLHNVWLLIAYKYWAPLLGDFGREFIQLFDKQILTWRVVWNIQDMPEATFDNMMGSLGKFAAAVALIWLGIVLVHTGFRKARRFFWLIDDRLLPVTPKPFLITTATACFWPVMIAAVAIIAFSAIMPVLNTASHFVFYPVFAIANVIGISQWPLLVYLPVLLFSLWITCSLLLYSWRWWNHKWDRVLVRQGKGKAVSLGARRGSKALQGVSMSFSGRKIVGQDHFFEIMNECLASAPLKHNTRQPRAVVAIMGPTGTGKTEFAKWLAETQFGSLSALFTLPMNNYKDEHSIWTLLGAERGYHDSEMGGELTEGVKARPQGGVLLLDELDKGFKGALEIFMNAFDEGSIKDRRGSVISFSNWIVVMTANWLAKDWKAAVKMGESELRQFLVTKENLKPETVGRWDAVMVANGMSPEMLTEIIGLRLGELKQKLAVQGLNLVWDSSTIDRLKGLVNAKASGARDINRAVQRKIGSELVKLPAGGGALRGLKAKRDVYVYPDAKTGKFIVTMDKEQWTKAERWKAMARSEQLQDRSKILRQTVVGQDHALDQIEELLEAKSQGFTIEAERPRLVLGLFGPTSTGKTETAKAIARYYYGSENALAFFNMGDFKQPHTVARFCGAPPGYAGHEQGSELGRKVESYDGKCVVLLDEIEKAHPDVWTSFLAVLREGILIDGSGTEYDMRNTVFVLTSNHLADQWRDLLPLNQEQLKDTILATSHFSREFLARIELIAVYKGLEENAVQKILEIRLQKLAANAVNEPGVELHWTPGVVQALTSITGQSAYGVARMDEVITDFVIKPLSKHTKDAGGVEAVKGKKLYLFIDKRGSVTVSAKPLKDIGQYAPGAHAAEWSQDAGTIDNAREVEGELVLQLPWKGNQR
jgi:ATP-dependent Clp protease ATP-binding subunit ClpA